VTLKASRRKNPVHQTGFTLIELLVSLGISSFLVVGAVKIYGQSRQAFLVNESIAQV